MFQSSFRKVPFSDRLPITPSSLIIGEDGISGLLKTVISLRQGIPFIQLRHLVHALKFHSLVCHIHHLNRPLGEHCLLKGTQIYVYGLLPPGNEPVSANYSIDNGTPQSKSLDASTSVGNTFVANSSFFVSPQLAYGNHTISIVVTETGQNGRNYSLDFFDFARPIDPPPLPGSATGRTKRNIGAIAGGVVGALVTIVIIIIIFLWTRRRKVQSGERSKFPQLLFFGRTKSSEDECTSLSSGTVRPEAEISTVYL